MQNSKTHKKIIQIAIRLEKKMFNDKKSWHAACFNTKGIHVFSLVVKRFLFVFSISFRFLVDSP